MQHGYITGASPSVIGQVGGEYKTASRLDDRNYADQIAVGQLQQRPMTEIEDQLNALGKQVDRIGQVSDCLLERISPILSRRGPAPTTGQVEAPEPVLCTHASILRSLMQRLARYAQQLEDGHHAVEL